MKPVKIIGTVICLAGLLAGCSNSASTQNVSQTSGISENTSQSNGDTNGSNVQQTVPQTVQPTINTLTLDEYNKLSIGMTTDQVKAILGTDGKIVTDTDTNGLKVQLRMYESGQPGDPDYANIMLTYNNGTLYAKTQSGGLK